MNWDQIEGKWQEITGRAKSVWDKLTDDDIKDVAGKGDVLIGRSQARHAVVEDAEQRVDDGVQKLDLPASDPKHIVGKDK